MSEEMLEHLTEEEKRRLACAVFLEGPLAVADVAKWAESLAAARAENEGLRKNAKLLRDGLDRFALLLTEHEDFVWTDAERHLYAELTGEDTDHVDQV